MNVINPIRDVPVHSIAAWPAQSFVDAGGCQLHYRVAGHGPAVVLLHGMLGFSFCWRRNIDALARHFTVYALDLPGMGYSTCPPAYDGSFAFAAGVVAAFCARLGIGRVSLVGHSFGGTVALVCAARFPELVTSVCAITPANPYSRHARFQLRLAKGRLGALIIETAYRFPRLLSWFLRHRLYARPHEVDPETLEVYQRVSGHPAVMQTFKTTVSKWDMNALKQCLKEVQQPTLLIWGARDKVVPLYSAAPLAKEVQARLEVLEGEAHMVIAEASERVNALLIGFLRETAEHQ